MPRVVTVHDLIYEHYPESFPGIRTPVLRQLVPRMLRRATRVISDSEATRRDVVGLYGVDPERADVVHLGPGAPPIALSEYEAREIRSDLGLGAVRALGRHEPAAQEPAAADRGLRDRVGRERPDPPRARRRRRPGAGAARRRGRGGGHPRGRELYRLARRSRARRASTRVPSCSSTPRSARASACRCSRRWSATCPCSARARPRCPRWGATPWPTSTRPASPELARELGRLLDDPGRRAELVTAGRRQFARFGWRRTALETLASYELALDAA